MVGFEFHQFAAEPIQTTLRNWKILNVCAAIRSLYYHGRFEPLVSRKEFVPLTERNRKNSGFDMDKCERFFLGMTRTANLLERCE
ncbi:hypothetical protein CEXT_56401 [Caerostris extrusa]|uniref:Uncharacterized protein n=1 Tax=Caerostris extrusa TaxID=172846 RepID=A0AAV4T509_CAEEX|nr:hypothetical protein CEXT_56401 [Caerostris extrusa]